MVWATVKLGADLNFFFFLAAKTSRGLEAGRGAKQINKFSPIKTSHNTPCYSVA
jgi:hypothetical protein